MAGLFENRFEDGLREMVQAVHEAGGKIALQIVHASDGRGVYCVRCEQKRGEAGA